MPGSNNELVDYLCSREYIESEKVEEAFRELKRQLFVPETHRQEAYRDRPLSIADGSTISAPHMVAINTELLEVEEDSKVLEIGSGSGYQLAVLAELAKKAVGIEIKEELVENSRERLKDRENASVVHGDGLDAIEEKFDRILYSAAIDKEEWNRAEEFLKEDGILVAPVKKNSYQVIQKLKDEEVTEHSRVKFVEMV